LFLLNQSYFSIAGEKQMDFRQLQTFLTVRDTMNFTKAAQQLGYAQSSITAQIQQLETELNARLFERIGKSITLTDAGNRLVPYALEILRLFGTLKTAVPEVGAPSGTLTIGTAESLSISRLPPILKEYRRLYPGVELSLKLLCCGDFLPSLSRGDIDAAFSIGVKLAAEQIREIAVLPEPILVLAPPDHPLTRKAHVTEGDFENEALLLTGPGCYYGGAFLERMAGHQVPVKVALQTDSVQVIKQAAMSGLGLCVLPAVAVREEVSAGKLIPLRFDTADYGIVSQLFIHKDKWLSPALQAFLELAARMLGL
jgi:DNA-binding transcriptional LysR family regulator